MGAGQALRREGNRMTDLAELRSHTAEQLDELKRKRGAAVLDGAEGTILSDEIAATRATVEAIAEAEAERTRRARQMAAEHEAERVEKLRSQYLAENAKRIEAVARAEVAGRSLAQAARDAIACSDRMNAAAVAAPVRMDDRLGKSEFARRLSHRLSITLRNISHPGRFGELTLTPGPFPTDGDWTEAERTIGAEFPTRKEN
jgi:hypothetical protein